jgi:hypothetical protein
MPHANIIRRVPVEAARPSPDIDHTLTLAVHNLTIGGCARPRPRCGRHRFDGVDIALGPAMPRASSFSFVVVLAASAVIARTAWAAEEADTAPATAAYGVAGFGTPVGSLGLEAVHRLTPSVELTAGVGLGLSAAKNGPSGAAHVLQWAVMPRYRVGTARAALTLGVGLSGGNYSHTRASLCGADFEELECNSPGSWRYTLWGNFEIGGEHWFQSGFAFRYFAGYGRVLAQGARNCAATTFDCDDVPGSSFPYYNIPYFGLALGRAF